MKPLREIKVRVDIRFMDCKHYTVCHAILASEDLYDFDIFMYEAIHQLGLHPDPGDKFEIISFKVENLKYVHPIEK